MILTTDIQFLLSAPQAAAGYVMPGSPGNSLGLFTSTSQLSASTDNLFTDLTGAQNASFQVDYGCVFIYNSNQFDAMLNPVAWLPSALLGVNNTATFQIGADGTSPSPLSSVYAQAAVIQSPILPPSNIATWATPSANATGGVALSVIPPGCVAAVWIRRTAHGTASGNSVTVQVTCDSLA